MQCKYTFKFFILIILLVAAMIPFNVHALEIKSSGNYLPINILTKSDACSEENNTTVFGNVDCDKSVAWLLQKILNYIRILGPSLAIVLTIVDFTSAIVSSSDDHMKKVKTKFINRLIAVVLLFFIPTLVMLLLDLVGLTESTGGLY